MSSKSKKAASDSSGIRYDSQTKAVVTALPPGQQKSITQMISSVTEVVTNRSKNEISLVLQYYDYNISDTIAAFMEDGAAKALEAWNFNGAKTNKKNKKKDAEKDSGAGGQDDVSSNNQTSKATVKTSSATGKEYQNGSASSIVKGPDANVVTGVVAGDSAPKEKPTTQFAKNNNNKNSQSKGRGERTESITESINDGTKLGRGKMAIDRCSKELGRHALSLQRTRLLLNEEIDKSEKRLKQSFQELRRAIDTREAELAKELTEVKLNANALLNTRQDSASRMTTATNRAEGMTEDELNVLRIDIKHFVSERKLDDDLGRTVRFVRDHNRLLKEIQEYGEVVPVKNQFTGRRQSLSSTTSSLTQSDPSVSAIASPVIKNSVTSDFTNPSVSSYSAPASNRTQSLSELAELQQRLHASLKLQGLPTTQAPTRRPQKKAGGQSGSRGNAGSPQTNGSVQANGSQAYPANQTGAGGGAQATGRNSQRGGREPGTGRRPPNRGGSADLTPTIQTANPEKA